MYVQTLQSKNLKSTVFFLGEGHYLFKSAQADKHTRRFCSLNEAEAQAEIGVVWYVGPLGHSLTPAGGQDVVLRWAPRSPKSRRLRSPSFHFLSP